MDNINITQILRSVRNCFTRYQKYEFKSRDVIYKALTGCYDLYLHWDENFVQEKCEVSKIRFDSKNKIKTILRLALNYGFTEEAAELRLLSSKIRTYVRVLKYFDKNKLSCDEAMEKLKKEGIDGLANPREKAGIKKQQKYNRRWTPTVKFNNVFKNSTVAEDDFVTLKIGEAVYLTSNPNIVSSLKGRLKADFKLIDDLFKNIVKQQNGRQDA